MQSTMVDFKAKLNYSQSQCSQLQHANPMQVNLLYKCSEFMQLSLRNHKAIHPKEDEGKGNDEMKWHATFDRIVERFYEKYPLMIKV